MVVAAVSAAAIEIARIVTGALPVVAASIGLASCCNRSHLRDVGWCDGVLVHGRRYKAKGMRGHEFWVEGLEPICAGDFGRRAWESVT